MSAAPRDKGNTVVRLATALVLAPMVLLLLWLPVLDWALLAFVALLAAQGLREYSAIVRALGLDTMSRTSVLAGVAVVLWNGLTVRYGTHAGTTPMVGGLTTVLLVFATVRLFSGRHDVRALAADFLGVAYIAGFLSYLVVLHGIGPEGPGLITFLLVAVTWSDSGAYFIGRAFGRHKLAPVVSPKKSWEGAGGALLGAMAAVAVLAGLVRLFGWEARYPLCSLAVWLPMACLLSAVSQVGDLFESMFKRAAGVKDASQIFPGHGGVLDRCDGILFAAPVLYGCYHGYEWLASFMGGG